MSDSSARDDRRATFTRRQFLALTVAGASIAGGSIPLLAKEGAQPRAEPTGEMQYRTLGRTGQKVSIVGLGGAHIGMRVDEDDGVRIVRTAIDHGINFMDNCWDYNDGDSEVAHGQGAARRLSRQGLPDDQDRRARRKPAAARQIDESLQRLQTDRIDLMQFHEVIRMEDPDRIFAAGGAMEAVLAARQGRQDPLHRFHRTQEIPRSICTCSRSPPSTTSASTPCRCRST